jgi:hypothetical protein
MIIYFHMQTGTLPLRRMASMLACAILLFGTTGAAALDALAHAGGAHAEHHENRGGPEPQGSECVLCVAAAPAALPHPGALLPAAHALDESGDIVLSATRAPHSATYYLTPPGRGPPTA